MKAGYAVALAVIGFGLTSLIGVLNVSDKTPRYVSSGLVIVGVVLIVVGVALVVIQVVPGFGRRVRVFPLHGDALEFVKEQLHEVCRRGGQVFSTYLLGKSDRDDVVSGVIAQEKAADHKRPVRVKYDRLVMIDDPTREESWVKKFLSMGNGGGASKLTVQPAVYLVQSLDRPLVRFVRSLIPRASLLLIEFSGGAKQRHLVYVSIPDVVLASGGKVVSKFGFGVFHEELYRLASAFVGEIAKKNPLLQLLTYPSQYEQRKTAREHLEPEIERLLSRVTEVAYENPQVQHVGVFGSVGRMLSRGASRYDEEGSRPWRIESDLDLIIVVNRATNMTIFKRQVEDALKSEVDSHDVDIEWSRERRRFYDYRGPRHTDIQLHYQGDSYYRDDAPLLGYTIFSGAFHAFYSVNRAPVSEFLHVPTKPLSMRQRAHLYLSGQLGLDEFLAKCNPADQRIDPRRVIGINLQNCVWVLCGMYPAALQEASQFLREELGEDAGDGVSVVQQLATAVAVTQMEDLRPGHPRHKESLRAAIQFLHAIRPVIVDIADRGYHGKSVSS